MDILEQQYKLIRSSRMVMLDFISVNLAADINKPIKEFCGKSISYLLAHVTDVYKYWLGEMGMNKQQSYINDGDTSGINLQLIYGLYADVDQLASAFITQTANSINSSVSCSLRSGNFLTATPVELFTHVITHEFHHKGQLMTMCRLLGKTPPDTDIIRT